MEQNKSKGQAVRLLIALFVVALALLEAPELATLTDNTSNDPARIELTEDGTARASADPVLTESLDGYTATISVDFKFFPHIPALTAPPRAGRALLHLVVLQRK